jgi:hypothetical protein
MIKFLWFLTLAGSLLGGVGLVDSLLFAQGAPGQAAGAAISIGLAVIPYCLARAAEGLR